VKAIAMFVKENRITRETERERERERERESHLREKMDPNLWISLPLLDPSLFHTS
jgi:hypothetical protein